MKRNALARLKKTAARVDKLMRPSADMKFECDEAGDLFLVSYRIGIKIDPEIVTMLSNAELRALLQRAMTEHRILCANLMQATKDADRRKFLHAVQTSGLEFVPEPEEDLSVTATCNGQV